MKFIETILMGGKSSVIYVYIYTVYILLISSISIDLVYQCA